MSTVAPPTSLTRAPDAPPRTRALWLVLLAASLPAFMATLDNLVVTSALPVMARDLHPTVAQLQWFMDAYTLAFATFMLPAAALGDRIGRRLVFLLGIVVFAAGSIGGALSTTAAELITTRTVQGIGAAAILPLSLALLSSAVSPQRRAAAIGAWGGVTGLGVALGPVVGGAVVQGVSWQTIFWLNAPVAVVAVPLVLAGLRESRGRAGRIDIPGLLLAGGGVLAAVWAIIDANADGWGSARIVTMLTAAAVLLVAFVVRQRRTADPLVPLRLFRSRSFSASSVTSVVFSAGMFGVVFLLTQYLQIGQGYSPLAAGVRTLPWTAAPMIVAPIAGLLVARIGVRPLVVSGLVTLAAAFGWMALVLNTNPDGYAVLVPALVLAGLGSGLIFAPISTAVLHGLVQEDHATASSVNATLREVGVATGVAVLTAVFLASDGALTPTAFVSGLVPAMAVGAVLVAVGAAAAAFVPRGAGRA
ncbi:MAG: MFS transporter [Promicromonosporaceae bacterium]|nr:MFS transporter [Promicromonosporaceae bacterium]